jgi:hypothetical protein
MVIKEAELKHNYLFVDIVKQKKPALQVVFDKLGRLFLYRIIRYYFISNIFLVSTKFLPEVCCDTASKR